MSNNKTTKQTDAEKAEELVKELNRLNLKFAYTGGKVLKLDKVTVKPVPAGIIEAVKEALKNDVTLTASQVKKAMVEVTGYVPEQELTNHIKALEGMGVIHYKRMDRKAGVKESEITLASEA